MKFTKFDKSNMSNVRTGEAIIRFATKGANSISKTAAEGIGLTEKDKVAILQDNDNPEDWYLIKDKENGFPLREYSNGQFCFNCSAMARAIIKAFDLDTTSVSFKIQTDGQKCDDIKGGQIYLIITSDPMLPVVKDQE